MTSRRALVSVAVLVLAVVSHAVVRVLFPAAGRPAAPPAAPADMAVEPAGFPFPIALALITWGALLVLVAASWAHRSA